MKREFNLEQERRPHSRDFINFMMTDASSEAAADGRAIPCLECPARTRELCGALNDADVAEFFKTGERVSWPAGRTAIYENEPVQHVFNVTSGALMLERAASDGRRQVIAFLYPGEFLGFWVKGVSTVMVTPLLDTTLCRWGIPTVQELRKTHPGVQDKLIETVAQTLYSAVDHIFILGRMTAAERFSYFLIHIVARQGGRLEDGALARLDMTRRDIADYLGVTTETISRTISELRARGWIDLVGREAILLRDIAALQELAKVQNS